MNELSSWFEKSILTPESWRLQLPPAVGPLVSPYNLHVERNASNHVADAQDVHLGRCVQGQILYWSGRELAWFDDQALSLFRHRRLVDACLARALLSSTARYASATRRAIHGRAAASYFPSFFVSSVTRSLRLFGSVFVLTGHCGLTDVVSTQSTCTSRDARRNYIHCILTAYGTNKVALIPLPMRRVPSCRAMRLPNAPIWFERYAVNELRKPKVATEERLQRHVLPNARVLDRE